MCNTYTVLTDRIDGQEAREVLRTSEMALYLGHLFPLTSMEYKQQAYTQMPIVIHESLGTYNMDMNSQLVSGTELPKQRHLLSIWALWALSCGLHHATCNGFTESPGSNV